jgi:hypothetical protein
MRPLRLLLIVLCALIVLSGVNYLFYYERGRSLDAQSREAVNSLVTNPLGTIVKSADIVEQKQQEYHNMVNREIVFLVLCVVGIIATARRR